MRVFVYEYVCGSGAHSERAAPSLWREGWAMLTAVLADFGRCPGVIPSTLLSGDHPEKLADLPAAEVELVPANGERASFHRQLRRADAALVIAPEFAGTLEDRTHWVEAAGVPLLGSSSAAVRLTADKNQLALHLLARGVPTPPCVDIPRAGDFPVVCKPRDGAGSLATFLARTPRELEDATAVARAEGWGGELLVQPFVPGQAASIACLVGDAGTVALPAAAQRLSEDGRFRYEGGSVPLPEPLCARAARLGRRAVEVVPGLRGYVGVDVVLGPDEDGHGDRVIEINPRLTTSYTGLRRLARFNLAEAILAAALGRPLPEFAWHPGPVHFTADGSAAPHGDGGAPDDHVEHQ